MELQLAESCTASSSLAECVLIPEDGVDTVWPLLAPLFEQATSRTRKIDLDSLRECALAGDMQLWAVYDMELNSVPGAIATELVTYTSGVKSARILLLGGSGVSRYVSLIDTIECWAQSNDCSLVEIVGRRGWGRIYPDYQPIEHWLAKEI